MRVFTQGLCKSLTRGLCKILREGVHKSPYARLVFQKACVRYKRQQEASQISMVYNAYLLI